MFTCFLVTCNYDTAAERTSGCRLKTSDEWFKPFLGSARARRNYFVFINVHYGFWKADIRFDVWKWCWHRLAAKTKRWQMENAARSRAPNGKSSPPDVRRNRKTALGVNMLIYSLMPEKDATPVRKKRTQSDWQQGVHKERLQCGVWQKRVK